MNLASEEADLFVLGSAETNTISGFATGDLLFVGAEFTFNTDKLEDGNAYVLEAFFAQSGNDTKVYLETKTYGSNEASVNEVVITLSGVKAADLTLNTDGFVTFAA